MTQKLPLAKLAMRALADAPLDVVDVSRHDAEAAVAAIALELEAVRKGRRRRLFAVVALGAAAAIMLTVGMTWRRGSVAATASVESVSGGVMLMRGERGATMARGDGVAAGDHVLASAEGSATLRLRNGTELRAVHGADVVVAEQGASQVFELRAGTVQLRVTKLELGERFIVRTRDAEVEVRGTEFSVDVGEECAGTTTRVAVREGTVVVRHAGLEARVTVNESWPPQCARSASLTPPPPPLALASPASSSNDLPPPPTTRTEAVLPVITNAPTRPVAASSSALAEQNRLFAEALAAKRRGDVPATLAALDRLGAAHPTGPLAESASVERMRVLGNVDRKRGADAARAYLALYPNGYARDEARGLTTPP